jgi:hypothetical protein
VIARSSVTISLANGQDVGEGILTDDGTYYLPVFEGSAVSTFSNAVALASVTPGDRKTNRFEIPVGTRFIRGITLKHDPLTNQLLVCGFWSERRNGNTEGFYFSKFSLGDFKWQPEQFILFTDSIRNATGERSIRKAMNDYLVRQIIVRKDGGFALLCEDYYQTVRTNSSSFGGSLYFNGFGGFGGQTIREYHYDDVLAMSIDPQGTLSWFGFVHKSQYSQEDGGMYSSYALLKTGGALGILFNDLHNNSTRVHLADIDNSGIITMSMLRLGQNDEPVWLPRSAKQTAARELVVPCFYKRQLCFARLSY